MRMVIPAPIGDAQLVECNIAEELPRSASAVSYNAWDSATTYALSAQVCHVFTPIYGFYPQLFTTPGSRRVGYGVTQQPLFALWTSRYAGNLNAEPGNPFADPPNQPGYSRWTLGSYAAAWDSAATYPAGTVVGRISGGSGAFYQSLASNNTGNDPASSPAWWQQTGVSIAYEAWSGATTYAAGDRVVIVQGTSGFLYESLQGGNLNKAPQTQTAWWQFLGENLLEWDSTRTYAAEDRVIDLRTHRIYESAAGSNLNHDPTTDTAQAWWLDAGPTNRWAMFDNSIGSVTAYGGEVSATLQPGELVDTLALLGLVAAEAWISSRGPQATTRNLLTWTEDFSNAAWTKTSATASTAAGTDPLGETGMNLLTATSAGGIVSQAVTFTGDGTKALSVFLRAGTATDSALVLRDTSAGADRLNVALAWSSGTPSATVTAGALASLTDKGNGVWELKATASGVIAANTNQFRLLPAGAGTGTVQAWGAQAENAAACTSYQLVTSSFSGFDLVYAQYFDLADSSMITSWRRYYFDPITYQADLLVQDLPPTSGAQIRYKLTRSTGTVEVGDVITGLSQDLGATLIGTKNGIRDYSRKEFDTFGQPQFTERGFAKTAELQVKVDNDQYDTVRNRIAARRAQVTLFIGDGNYAGLWIAGIPRDFSIGIPHFQQPVLDIQIEGLT